LTGPPVRLAGGGRARRRPRTSLRLSQVPEAHVSPSRGRGHRCPPSADPAVSLLEVDAHSPKGWLQDQDFGPGVGRPSSCGDAPERSGFAGEATGIASDCFFCGNSNAMREAASPSTTSHPCPVIFDTAPTRMPASAPSPSPGQASLRTRRSWRCGTCSLRTLRGWAISVLQEVHSPIVHLSNVDVSVAQRCLSSSRGRREDFEVRLKLADTFLKDRLPVHPSTVRASINGNRRILPVATSVDRTTRIVEGWT
jgi:hypothetical protein